MVDNQEIRGLSREKCTEKIERLLLNSPVPQFVVDRSFGILGVSESFKDLFVYEAENLSQLLTKESYRKFVSHFASGHKGSVDLVFKSAHGKESRRTYISEQEGIYYVNLFEINEVIDSESNNSAEKIHLNEALISLEELHEKTEDLRKEANDRKNYLRKIIDTAPSLIDVRDENGTILLANKSLANMLGVDVKSLIGTRFIDHINSEQDRARISRNHNEAFENWEKNFFPVDEVHLGNGKTIFLKEQKVPFTYKKQKGILSINVVIDDLVESERQLQHSRQRYKRIFEHSPVGIFHYDTAGRIKRCNSKFAEIVGSSIEKLLGFDMFAKFEQNEISEAIYNSLKEGYGDFEGWYHFEKTRKSTYAKAMFRSLQNESGQIIGGVGIIEDLTDFILTAQESTNSRNLLDTVFNSLEDKILVINKDYNLVMSNLQTNGITDALSGNLCFECVSPNRNLCNNCHLSEVFETGVTSRWDTYDEDTGKYLEISMFPVKNEEGDVIKVVEHMRDISERKEIEKNLEQATQEAINSEKLKSAFLQNISHEIRTPMNSIVGFSELIQEKGLTEEQRIDYGQIIKSNTTWLLNVVDQIIMLSKIESFQLDTSIERLNFNNLIRDFRRRAEQKISAQNKNRLRIVTHMPLTDELAYIKTDYELFIALMDCLIDNAVKFSVTGLIEIGYLLSFDGEISFYVKDEGRGIPAEHHDTIFKAFHQVENTDYTCGGNGLGLAIAQGLSDYLHGKLSVQSNPGVGSVFSLRLPFNFMD